MKVWVADEENGCEECWDELRAAQLREGLAVAGCALHERVEVPQGWPRLCPHDAPAYAPSILREED